LKTLTRLRFTPRKPDKVKVGGGENKGGVTLPDGTIMTRSDLPPAETRRWVASRKIRVVNAVAYGLIPLKEALKRYGLSEEEFEIWRHAVDVHGEKALKVTTIQKYRQL
jgi:hypothetical protein